MAKLLPRQFYLSDDVVGLAKDLLGKKICTNIGGKLTSGYITEAEAYRAPQDKASHAYNNKRTPRTETMFEKGGVSYIYLCYGMHSLLNIVTAVDGIPHAVLIRAIEPVDGIEHMLHRRNHSAVTKKLCAGPGILTKALGINVEQNRCHFYSKESVIQIEEGITIKNSQIKAATRVGIDYAEEYKDKLWRFYLKDNKWVSKT